MSFRSENVVRVLVLSGLFALAWGVMHVTDRLRAQAASAFPVTASPRYLATIVGAGGEALVFPLSMPVPVERKVRRGQTLAGLFADLGLDKRESYAASRAAMKYLDPRRLRAGALVTAYVSPPSRVERVLFYPSPESEVEVERTPDGWRSRRREYELVRRDAHVDGRLESVLEVSMREAGAPGQLAYALADVFQWDLDFNRDLRTGDRFRVLYEEIWIEGARSRMGKVWAAVYENRGAVLEAYRFGDAGYYDQEGRPLRKRFLRSPLPYSRVTSSFSHRRFHPILKVYRPHLGVDYGAPTGTPVRATASGTVLSASWSKGGGKTVKIRHPNGYTTAYLHLSRYGEGIRRGRRVRRPRGGVGAVPQGRRHGQVASEDQRHGRGLPRHPGQWRRLRAVVGVGGGRRRRLHRRPGRGGPRR